MAGKPPAEIDLDQLEKLAQLHATIDEAASFFGCCKRTLLRWLEKEDYRDAWARGREKGKLSLRRLQWQHASGKGSSAVQMTIHLSKHWLGETEKVLNEHSGGIKHDVEVTADAVFGDLVAILDDAARGRTASPGPAGDVAPAGAPEPDHA